MRKQGLYAPRLQGDLDLGLEPSRLSGDSAKAWARMDFPGRRLPGLADQVVYEDSITQKFEIGTRRQEYSRTFRYSLAGAALAGLSRLLTNSNYAPGVTGHTNEDGYEGAVHANADIGSLYIDITDTTAAVNYYQGAMLIIFGTTVFHQYHCVKSDVSTGVYTRLYLDKAVYEENITTAMGITAYLSTYSAVQQVGSVQAGFEAAVGLNLIPVASGSYFWMLTRGPCWVTPTGGTWPGSAAQLRAVYLNPNDGTIQPASISDPTAGYQYVGYVLSATGGSASDYGDGWIWLELE